jgi:hypothetical protein
MRGAILSLPIRLRDMLEGQLSFIINRMLYTILDTTCYLTRSKHIVPCINCSSHPSHSPDIAPLDYHMFGPPKEALRVRRFARDDEVTNAVHALLRLHPKTSFAAGGSGINMH